jgi:hypothetical protein
MATGDRQRLPTDRPAGKGKPTPRRPPQGRGSRMFATTRNPAARRVVVMIMVVGVIAAVFAVGLAATLGN